MLISMRDISHCPPVTSGKVDFWHAALHDAVSAVADDTLIYLMTITTAPKARRCISRVSRFLQPRRRLPSRTSPGAPSPLIIEKALSRGHAFSCMKRCLFSCLKSLSPRHFRMTYHTGRQPPRLRRTAIAPGLLGDISDLFISMARAARGAQLSAISLRLGGLRLIAPLPPGHIQHSLPFCHALRARFISLAPQRHARCSLPPARHGRRRRCVTAPRTPSRAF